MNNTVTTTKNAVIELVKSTQVFTKDMNDNATSVKALDNIRDFIFNVNQVFTPDGATKVALDDICQRCLVYSDSFKPNVDLVDMAKKINSVRFDVMLELKTAKIDIFQTNKYQPYQYLRSKIEKEGLSPLLSCKDNTKR